MRRKPSLILSTSLIALAGATTPAFAQATDQPPISTPAEGSGPTTSQSGAADEIIVTGVRASLRSAQTIKRNATQVVDSIVAEDIGKLPDNTVSDALQRVTGIQVTRASGEANSVQLRGLPDIQSYINGRETFTGTGRGVALADIPAELVAGIDVYKTLAPDQIEGAIAGAIDIRLRRPFDFGGLQIAGGARGLYSEQAGKWSYIGSGLASNRWTSASGQEFGILVGGSYNRRRYENQTAFNFGFNPVTSPATGNAPLLIPDTVGGLVSAGDRERIGANVALQWKPTPDLEFNLDGLFTRYQNDFDTDFFVGLPKAGNITATTSQGGSGTTAAVASTITTRDNFTISSKQTFREKTDNYQGNAGVRWTTGRATLSSELTYNKSQVDSQQFVLDTAYVVPRIDYNFNVKGTPNLNFNGFDYRNPAVLNLLTLFDNSNAADSEQIAWRGDLAFDTDSGGPLKSLKMGVRYARRTGESGGTNGTGFPIAFLPSSQFQGIAANAPNDILGGKLGVDGFALADSGYIRENIVTLRGLAGLPAAGRTFDPALVFDLTETVYAFYGQAGYGLDLGNVAVSGVFGARVVNTESSLNAIQTTVIPTGPTTTRTVTTPINGRRNELKVLPSFSLKAQVLDNVVVRALASKSLLRPQFAQLNPATSLTQLGITGGTFGSGSGGNSDLNAVTADNFDASAEWYFSNVGSLTAGVFYKKLNNYIQTYATQETFTGANGQPQVFLVARPRNSGKGTLKGVEVGYQQFFDFLPGPLSGLGAQANFTLAKGSVDSPPDAATGAVTRQPITATSKYSYNLVAIYEKYGFSARLAYNWRSSFTDSYSTAFQGGRIVVDPLKFLDFSASYAINDAVTVTVDATNLLDEQYQDSFGTSGLTPRDTRQYDRTFGAGVRFRF